MHLRHSNQYLYGEDVEIEPIPNELLVRRLEALNDNLRELLTKHYFDREEMRINAVVKAIDFWENINNGENNEKDND